MFCSLTWFMTPTKKGRDRKNDAIHRERERLEKREEFGVDVETLGVAGRGLRGLKVVGKEGEI